MTRKFRSTEFKDIGNEMNEIIIDYSIVNVLGYNTTWLYSVTVTVRWIEAVSYTHLTLPTRLIV